MAASVLPLKQLFQTRFTFKIDRKLAEQIIRWKLLYETRDQHAEALNTPLLGCYQLGFYPRDSQALFDLLGINREEFKQAIRQSSIDNNFKVASDDYNLLTVWAAHCFMTTTAISNDLKTKVVRAIFFMLVVKFFSSVVRHFLPYKANKNIMEMTIDSLTDKFEIKHKDTNTWKLIMEKRAAQLAQQQDNIHWNALRTFTPDQKVVYIITDLETRIRTKIRIIMGWYYDAVKKGNQIAESGLTTDNADGEKIIKELKNSYDSMIESICNRVLNAQQFIRNDYLKFVCAFCSNVDQAMMKAVLLQFSALATYQHQKHKQDDMDKTGKLFAGYHILISNLIQRTYRACIIDKVNLRSRVEIFIKAKNLYRSSRINDETILKVKESVSRFVDGTKVSKRDATNASLKIAFIIYIILMSLDMD